MVFFNKAAETLFGYNRTECIGRNVKMLMPDPFQSEHDSYLNNYNRSHISKIMNTGRGTPYLPLTQFFEKSLVFNFLLIIFIFYSFIFI